MNNIIIKNPSQIQGIKKACKTAALVLDVIEKNIKPNITTKQIEEIGLETMKQYNATSATKGYEGFNAHLCVAPNDVICHGIPGDYQLQEGDIVGVDVALTVDGYFGDTCRTFAVGQISSEAEQLIDVTKHCLHRGIKEAYPGNHLSNIGYAIQKYAEKKGCSVVRDYCGHGVGIRFHEEPQVLHYGRKNRGPKLEPGMIFTIEPMINSGSPECVVDKEDGWTAQTKDQNLSAQFEHTILVTDNGAEILTLNLAKQPIPSRQVGSRDVA